MIADHKSTFLKCVDLAIAVLYHSFFRSRRPRTARALIGSDEIGRDVNVCNTLRNRFVNTLVIQRILDLVFPRVPLLPVSVQFVAWPGSGCSVLFCRNLNHFRPSIVPMKVAKSFLTFSMSSSNKKSPAAAGLVLKQ